MLHKPSFLIGLVLLVAAAALFGWAAGSAGATSAASGSGIGRTATSGMPGITPNFIP